MTVVLQTWMGQSRRAVPTGNVANGCVRSVRKWKALFSVLLRNKTFPDCPNMHCV